MDLIPARRVKGIAKGIDIGARGTNIELDTAIRIIEQLDETHVHVLLNQRIRITLIGKTVTWGNDCENKSWRKNTQCCNSDCIKGDGKGRKICLSVADPTQLLELEGNEMVTIREHRNNVSISLINSKNNSIKKLVGSIINKKNHSNINQLCKYYKSNPPRPCIPRCQTGYVKSEHASVSCPSS